MRSSERTVVYTAIKPRAGKAGGVRGVCDKTSRETRAMRHDGDNRARRTRARNTPRSVLSIAMEDDHRPEVDHVVYARGSRKRGNFSRSWKIRARARGATRLPSLS